MKPSILIAALLTVCSPAVAEDFGTNPYVGGQIYTPMMGVEIPLAHEDEERAKAAILPHLKDPDSAKFSNIHAYRAASHVFVCGQVNAKNSYGGYTGALLFMQQLDDPSNYGISSPNELGLALMIYPICERLRRLWFP